MDDGLWEFLLRLETLSLLSETGVTLTMDEFHRIMDELRRLYEAQWPKSQYMEVDYD